MNYLLVITEDRAVSSALRMILKDSFLLETVAPRQALGVVAARRPAIIFFDSQTGGTGEPLLQALLEKDQSLTIICLVGNLVRTSYLLDSGVFSLLEKPFTAEEVRHLVKRALEREQLLAENQKLKMKITQEGPASLPSEIREQRVDFYQLLLQSLSEVLSSPDELGKRLVTVVRHCFRFGTIAFFTCQGTGYRLLASIGLEEQLLSQLQLEMSHPLITWFVENRILVDVNRGKNLPQEIRSLSEVLKACFFLPLFSASGHLLGFLSFGRKVTGEETTGEELQRLSLAGDYLSAIQENVLLSQVIRLQASYQEAILESIPTGIVAVDQDGRLFIVNRVAEKILRLNAETMNKQDVEKLGSQMADYLRRALVGQEVSREEFVYVPTRAILGISTRSLRVGEKICGAVAAFQDLTEIKLIEKERRGVERDRYWNAVATRLSHELKNPLVAIKTFAQMLPEKYQDSEFRSSFSDIVQQEVARLNQIIEGIARLAEPLTLSPTRVNLTELIAAAGKEVGGCPVMKEELTGQKELMVEADSLRLREAFQHILQFCWRDTEGQAPVNCGLKVEEQKVIVEFREKGGKITLPEEDIFLPFVAELETHLSIGLVLARKIIEGHGGKMKLVQQPAEKKFVIELKLGAS
ncbi:MAG: PAS domain-containing protein [Candidatus Omnitrophica bacterium]|nr:PAS domain-containing protein [Candidatus Omnitrophota bacterium]